MFGLLFAGFTGIAFAISAAQVAVTNHQGKENARRSQAKGIETYNTYFDYRGVQRDMTTGAIVSVDPDLIESTGRDKCVRDMYGHPIRNITEERRQARKEKAIAEGRTVYMYRQEGNGIWNGEIHRQFGGDGYCEGAQFKDLKTGETYVARTIAVGKYPNIKTVPCYMSLRGYFVREGDSVVSRRKKGMDVPSTAEIDAAILKENEKQKKLWAEVKKPVDAFGNPVATDCLYESKLNNIYQNKYRICEDV